MLHCMKIVSHHALEQLIASARSAARKRQHLNIHTEPNEPIQRLFVAFEPGTYVQPHRHPEAGKWEMFVLLTGQAAVLLFDGHGRVSERVELAEQGANRLIEIPPQQWHTLVSLRAGTLLFETKPGPYTALADKDFASWAPKENTAHTREFVRWFESAQAGDAPPILNA
jgi:cupin fold WbuC family metalloprotein